MTGLPLWGVARTFAMALALGTAVSTAAPPKAPPSSTEPELPRAPGALAAIAPDLAVTEAFVGALNAATHAYESLPPEGAAVGQQLRLACFFTNRGIGFTGSFRVMHLVDGRVVAVSHPLPGLANGARTVDGLSFTPNVEGAHRYECAVNYDRAIAEAVTGNNRLGKDFRVRGPATMVPRDHPGPNLPAGPGRAPRISAVDLTVAQIAAQDGFWSTDWEVIGVAVITVTVKNVGMEEAPPREWQWQWIVDGVPRGCGVGDPRFGRLAGSDARFGLKAGESRPSSFGFRGATDDDIAGLKPGFVKQYRVKVRFNCDLAQAERDDGNNESREVPVWFKTRQGLPGNP
jgi:CARDB